VSNSALLELRPVRPEDEPFLTQLFTVTEHERLAQSGADAATLQAVIRHEQAGQNRHYRLLNEEASHCIILARGNPAGRLVYWENREEIRLAELAVAPAFRGLGIGSAVIDTLKARAMQSRRPLRLHVEKYHLRQPRRFYQRLGFRLLEDRHTHLFMEWDAAHARQNPVGDQLKMIS
jgi:ribosomal protein S18 acetylase RimI-like enzyme